MSAVLFHGLRALRVSTASTSNCIPWVSRKMRTSAGVQFTESLDEWDETQDDRQTSGLVKLPKRDWKTSTKNPTSLIQSRTVNLEPEELDFTPDETKHPGFLRKRIQRNPTPAPTRAHRETMKESFPGGWSPPHKLSRQAMDGLRVLHSHDPETFTTPVLATKFRISPEAVRRILKSKWEPSSDERVRLARREMKDKEQWIKTRRLAERQELQSMEQSRILEDLKHGRATGTNSKDFLSFV